MSPLPRGAVLWATAAFVVVVWIMDLPDRRHHHHVADTTEEAEAERGP